MNPHEPSPLPTAASPSELTGASTCADVMTGFATPDRTAFTSRPFGMPPPIRSITSTSVVPGSTSPYPALTTSPTTVQMSGPGVSRVPIVRYQPAPRVSTSGMLASVSTFEASVGFEPWAPASGAGPRPADHPSCGVVAKRPWRYG